RPRHLDRVQALGRGRSRAPAPGAAGVRPLLRLLEIDHGVTEPPRKARFSGFQICLFDNLAASQAQKFLTSSDLGVSVTRLSISPEIDAVSRLSYNATMPDWSRLRERMAVDILRWTPKGTFSRGVGWLAQRRVPR